MLRIYTDGACRGNPGPSAIAFVILDDRNEPIQERSKYVGIGTNNQAEYKALILALKSALNFGTEVKCYSDSNLLVNQMNGNWRVKHPNMKPLWKKAMRLTKEFRKISFTHKPRTNPTIKKVDALANAELDENE